MSTNNKDDDDDNGRQEKEKGKKKGNLPNSCYLVNIFCFRVIV